MLLFAANSSCTLQEKLHYSISATMSLSQQNERTPMASTEKFSMDEDGPNKQKGLSWNRVKILVGIFVIVVILVGLLSGLLAAQSARNEVEEKYEREALSSNNQKTTVTTITTTVATTATPPSCVGKIWCDVRLPKAIVPYHYNLDLTSDVDNLKYNGRQEIFLDISQPIDVIIVHIKEKMISQVSLNSLDGQTHPKIKRHFPYPENEFYVTEFNDNLPVGKYSFIIKFSSNVSKTLTGYYKSTYKRSGQKKTLLTTKFQPTDARRGFPCLDEPDFKATFNITMKHPSEYHARSNMPGVVSKTEGGWTTTSFGKTVKMSPYLICFIVSQFQSKYNGTTGNQNMNIAVWSQPDLIESTEYAYNTSIKIMEFLEDFLGVDYPMPKLDMFAIPDYGSGATEHWGIITYRESRLLYTPGVSSASNKASSAGIIAHECAHLWFGNLVTCKWWNDLWVQEGMASYLENYALNHTHPEWNNINGFLIGDWKTGMTLDAYATSHPISQPVEHPKKIKEIFDSITYNKGASLFQMLDYYLGLDKFKEGLNRYLTDNQFKGASVEDLWKAFDTVSGQDITGIMNTWTHQMGHPVIKISKTSAGFSLSQKHFLSDPQANVTRKSPFNYQWTIPFTYAVSEDLSKRVTKIMKDKTDTISSTAPWMVGNFNHRGFYRVNYDDQGWKDIQIQLNKDYKVFEPIDRAGFIDDAFALARAGETPYSVALDMLSFIEKDTTGMVWSMALSNLNFLDNILRSTNSYSLFRAFLAKKIKTVLDPTDWEAAYLGIAAKAGEESAVKYVTETFKAWMDNGAEIPTDLRSTVLRYGIAYGGDAEWDFVFNKFQTETNPSLRSKLQSALSATQKPWILTKWLRYSIDPSVVKTQDTVYVIGAIASSNPIGKYLAWNFASANWEKIIDIAKENNFHVAYVTSRITRQFTTEYDLKITEELWAKHPDAGTGANARAQGIELIKGYIYWKQKNYDTLETWLKNNQ